MGSHRLFPVVHILYEPFTITHPSWVALHGMSHSCIELCKPLCHDKAVIHEGEPFRYNLNQIPYDYTVEVTSRFKRLDLIDSVTEEIWTEVHNIVQEAVTKTTPKKKKCKKAKWFSEEALQTAEKRNERQRRKGKI